ncbi:MAG: bifunctional phosphopantothenoylcysteine decarboxylase/phosphopantothenate--cysteine ligase CoaBC [Gammaproteobacteria bacterium]
MTTKSTQILLIVTGGIAAYKALELVRRLVDVGCVVRVVMTKAAQEFVTPLSFQALSGQAVHTTLLDADAEAGMGHIELARWADRVLIAPASADFIARLAIGLADDLATTLCLATKAPILLAPAMNHQMWRNAATQANIAVLAKRQVEIIGPDSGYQACGELGPGRLTEIENIVAAVVADKQSGTMAGKRVLITAGPTQEAIDPVRYISNRSSGKMGYALAAQAAAAGAEVTLVSGPTTLPTPPVTVVPVVSAQDMYEAVMANIDNQHIFIASAAVADYTIDAPAAQKRKKSDTELNLTLTATQDILKAVAAMAARPFCVGFAAETENLVANAQEKLRRKSLDMIAANDVSDSSIGFDSDNNELTVIWRGGEQRLAMAAKDDIARQLINLIAAQYIAA